MAAGGGSLVARRSRARTLTVDMYPDLSEFGATSCVKFPE